jgi:TetR/AcrR family transcriptional regulator, transcriptional repressor for nem operon
MANETSGRPRLTAKGERVRARIVQAAAELIHDHGVAGTTLEDVKVAAQVSGSQLYHYFPDKDELLQAVINHQADSLVGHNRHALDSPDGIAAWRNMIVAGVRHGQGKGGCPLGSLGGQLAESNPDARALIAAGFERWSTTLSERLRLLHADGKLAPGIDPDDFAITLLATLQGGLLLAQLQQNPRPVETTVDCLLALAIPDFKPGPGQGTGPELRT